MWKTKKNTLCMYYNKNKYTIYLENKKNTICMETYGPPCIILAMFYRLFDIRLTGIHKNLKQPL